MTVADLTLFYIGDNFDLKAERTLSIDLSGFPKSSRSYYQRIDLCRI